MRKAAFYPRLAWVSLTKNARFYLPYLLTVIGAAGAFYIVAALAGATDLPQQVRYVYLSIFMNVGMVVIALFAAIFLTYTNSFLMKRRRREIGLYHILGLDKGNIARVLLLETLYVALAGIGGGLCLGMLLQKLVTMLLLRLMAVDFDGFVFAPSPKAMSYTALLFGAILLWNLGLNLWRMGRQSAMEMLREGAGGEREPKSRWLTTALGVLCLGGGYGIAVVARSPVKALALYFVAVILVIVGTYCLFSAISIAVLKALRRRHGFYYRPGPFITISGMLYRMKRNAVGLANICILSTMVLVMISGTLALYIGSERVLEMQFPGNLSLSVGYSSQQERAFSQDGMRDLVQRELEQMGAKPQALYDFSWLEMNAKGAHSGFDVQIFPEEESVRLCLISAQEYQRVVGHKALFRPVQLTFPGGETYNVSAFLAPDDAAPSVGQDFFSAYRAQWLVVSDPSLIVQLEQLLNREKEQAYRERELGESPTVKQCWTAFWNVDESVPYEQISERIHGADFAPSGGWEWMRTSHRQEFRDEYFSLNGGFFFLGLFLGLLFIMAAVLIVYYKQISEGYEDWERYQIMQKVGLEPGLLRRSVGGQILVVFFAPLLVAGIHVAFDFGLMTRLLQLFSVYDVSLTLLCTLGVFLLFALLYALVYAVTARAYYQIISRKTV